MVCATMHTYLYKDAVRCKHNIWCKGLCVIIVMHVVTWFYANILSLMLNNTSWSHCSNLYIFITLRAFYRRCHISLSLTSVYSRITDCNLRLWITLKLPTFPFAMFVVHKPYEQWEEKDQKPWRMICSSPKQCFEWPSLTVYGLQMCRPIASSLKNRIWKKHY